MKFGIKLWSTNKELIKNAREHYNKGEFDYIELSAIKDTFDKELLSNIKRIPIIIHCDNNNVNFANKEFNQNNLAAIKLAQQFADFFDSKYFIVHPGYNGNIKNIKKVLEQVSDNRICVENMPGVTLDEKHECVGRTFKELDKIEIKNFCLDLGHAIKSAITIGTEPYENIKELMKLNPKMFHICDGKLDNNKDEHTNIGEGEFDFGKIRSIIGEHDGLMTLEVHRKDYSSLDKDIKNIKKIKEFFSR